jgi:RNA 2',3'-cyclic 3'-phosphodiesterase
MRVFLAVDLRDTLGGAASDWGRAVAGAIGHRGAAALTWVPAERVHVTLHFFGTLDRPAVDAVLAALGDAVPVAPFDVRLGAGGTFPGGGRPRVLWLGFAAGADALARLHAWSEPRISGIGQADRHGAFTPHVTIARARRDASQGRRLREAVARTPAPDAGAHIEAITLFDSVPSGKGPAYVPIARVPLVGDAASR